MVKLLKKGFSLIEIALFLAVTAALFAGIAIGTNNTISQQRFTDSVQNFAEFLRSIYSEVSNPQSVGTGRSERAIYGKLVVFGEKYGLNYTELTDDDPQRTFVYDVVGDVVGKGTGTTEELLVGLKANVVVVEEDATTRRRTAVPAGIVESYDPRWAAGIERVGSDEAWEGSILVVRHPMSGTINTLVSDEVIEVNDAIRAFNNGEISELALDNLLLDVLKTSDTTKQFGARQVDFCVDPTGLWNSSRLRRDIRIVANARNASGVEIMDLDSDANLCR